MFGEELAKAHLLLGTFRGYDDRHRDAYTHHFPDASPVAQSGRGPVGCSCPRSLVVGRAQVRIAFASSCVAMAKAVAGPASPQCASSPRCQRSLGAKARASQHGRPYRPRSSNAGVLERKRSGTARVSKARDLIVVCFSGRPSLGLAWSAAVAPIGSDTTARRTHERRQQPLKPTTPCQAPQQRSPLALSSAHTHSPTPRPPPPRAYGGDPPGSAPHRSPPRGQRANSPYLQCLGLAGPCCPPTAIPRSHLPAR